ncbi:MAG: hypothetical protein KKA42_02755 [candidate division Zixibacteria bacterium]|nr:hypothetical protein [candidate division Zixibacteria bacterium]
MNMIRFTTFLILLALAVSEYAAAAAGTEVQARMDADIVAGRPILVHVIVALCDNKHQGIVPVPAQIGNGQDPAHNLYWGALYGVRSFFPRVAGWNVIAEPKPDTDSILATVVMQRKILRDSALIDVFLVAEAWDGRYIKGATMRFLDAAGGAYARTVTLRHETTQVELSLSTAHMVVYAGHDGLMDFRPDRSGRVDTTAPARSAVVLACASRSFFERHLRHAGAHNLLLTTGLMAPEAYTLDAVIKAWISGGSGDDVNKSAADAYDRYQKCGQRAARRLFFSAP